MRSDALKRWNQSGITNYTFDYSYDGNAYPGQNSTQRMAAITQLFYDDNFFHDWYYDVGFNEAAFENGQSRIYLGIHWAFDRDDGITCGKSVADYVFDNFLQPAP